MSVGHEAVKADLVQHLTDGLPAWVAVLDDNGWPPPPALVAATDLLPVDEDKPWPCVLVSTTSLDLSTRDAAMSGTTVDEYTAKVTVAVRTSKSKDVDDATVGRDRLLDAVRFLLLTSPQAGDDTTIIGMLPAQADPAALDPKGRPVAVGTLTVRVRHVETVPDLGARGPVDQIDLLLGVTDADGVLVIPVGLDMLAATVTAAASVPDATPTTP